MRVRARFHAVALVCLLAGCKEATVAQPAAPPEPAASPAPAPDPSAPPEPAPESAPSDAAGASEPPAGAPPAGAPASYELQGNMLVLPRPVEFAAGSDQLAGEAALEHIRGYLAAKSYVTLMRIEAHASGPDGQALSERRALAAARWLVRKGVDCRRLLPVGFGATKPIASEQTPEGRAQNTRVEAHNAALRERLIGGMPADGGGKVAGDPCA